MDVYKPVHGLYEIEEYAMKNLNKDVREFDSVKYDKYIYS